MCGFEIGYHNATLHTSNRDETIAGLDRFAEIFGHNPHSMAHHYYCDENIYWGDCRVSGVHRPVYNALTRWRNHGRYFGHVEGHPYFWGDLCRERVRYVRNFVFAEINTLAACPWMPYHDPARPYVNSWFASSDGANAESFLKCVNDANQDRLEADGGCCIMYTHFAHGFVTTAGKLEPKFRRAMERLAAKNGWFAPVKTVLDLLQERNPPFSRSGPPAVGAALAHAQGPVRHRLMGIRVVPHAPQYVEEVRKFNDRLRGVSPFLLGEAAPGDPPPLETECGVSFHHFVAVDDLGVVRGGYFIRTQPFLIRERVYTVGHFTSPLSEGLIDRRYAAVGALLLSHALKFQPLLFAMGMGSLQSPLPRILKAAGWPIYEVPFLFRVLNGSRFLRNLGALHTSAPRSFFRKRTFRLGNRPPGAAMRSQVSHSQFARSALYDRARRRIRIVGRRSLAPDGRRVLLQRRPRFAISAVFVPGRHGPSGLLPSARLRRRVRLDRVPALRSPERVLFRWDAGSGSGRRRCAAGRDPFFDPVGDRGSQARGSGPRILEPDAFGLDGRAEELRLPGRSLKLSFGVVQGIGAVTRTFE